MSNKQEKPNLEYIQINHKNKIEELPVDQHISETFALLKKFPLMEDSIGGEINKLFQGILPESKETEPLKLIKAMTGKTKIENELLEKCLNNIMNKVEGNFITLTKDLIEELAVIIKEIFKKIKNNSKIKNYGQLMKEISTKYSFDYFVENDILKKYQVQRPKESNDSNLNNFKLFSKGKMNLSGIKIPESNGNDFMYKFKKFKEDSKSFLPVEMLILIKKFMMVKRLKLTISNNNNDYEDVGENSELILDQNNLQNTILVLLNSQWLFCSVVELEIDLSNEYLTEDEIQLYKYNLKKFARLVHKEIKITKYTNNSYSKRNYDSTQKSLFSQVSSQSFEEDRSSDHMSSSMASGSNLNYTNLSLNQNTSFNNSSNNISLIQLEEKGKTLDNFLKKYKILLEMIIIYGYFIRRFEKIINIKFIFPLNLGEEISEMSKKQNILMSNFHFLSFIQKSDLLRTTIDFNSLDNQTFEKVLSFLNKNQLISICNLSFFPPEEYFRTELLFKILQTNNNLYKLRKQKNGYSFDQNIINDLRTDEDLDTYILRKLSKDFEKNMKDLFYLLTIKTSIFELSLFLDLPSILVKNGFYNNILMKFFLNMFIIIDKTLTNLKTLSINAENFILDSRKNPILNIFFDKLSFYINKENKLTSLTFQVRFYSIKKIYRLIPYNLTDLSLGSFDYETFISFVECVTLGEFRQRAKLSKLKITLNNSVFEIDKIYKYIVKLFTEYPKQLIEISLCTYLTISFNDLTNLLIKTNYNTLSNIHIQFNKKSFKIDNQLQKLLEYDISYLDADILVKYENFSLLYKIKRIKRINNMLIDLMMRLHKKNKNIMKYKIFANIEKFLCPKEKKNVIIQFKHMEKI